MKRFLGRDGSPAQDHFGKVWQTSSLCSTKVARPSTRSGTSLQQRT